MPQMKNSRVPAESLHFIPSAFLSSALPSIGCRSPSNTRINVVFPSPDGTREFFSYVPQGNTIFAGSIAENMRMVKEDATDEEIREVLEMACAYDFVKKLPKGMETVVGEKGSGLSEGQAQRLAIARALLKNAPVLIS